MAKERAQTNEQTTEGETEQETDSAPELVSSEQRKHDHQPDAYPTGYDPFGETRVGVGAGQGKTDRLIRLNEGRHHSDGDHSTREAARDKKRITESFCSALDVTTYQQHRAVTAMTQMNLDRFGQQKQIEKVALCTICVIVDRERRHYFLNGDPPSEIDFSQVDEQDFPTRCSQEDEFQALCSQYGVSDKDHYSVTQLVQRELKQIGYFEREDQPIQ